MTTIIAAYMASHFREKELLFWWLLTVPVDTYMSYKVLDVFLNLS